MSKDVIQDCDELQKEEIDALREIYISEEFHARKCGLECSGDVAWTIDVRIKQVQVLVELPRLYPLVEPPRITVKAWPKKDKCSLDNLYDTLNEMFSPGDVAVFSHLQHVQDVLTDLNDAEESAEVAVVEMPAESVTRSPKSESLLEDCIMKVISGEPITFQKSTFQAHMARVHSVVEVKAFIRAIRSDRKLIKAIHPCIYAYRIELSSCPKVMLCDNDDDGEKAAGSRLAHLLEILGVTDVIVAVTRWFGGTLLGPKRFKYINNVARELLVKNGLVS